MSNFNYQKICQDVLKMLPEKQKEVILRRFGLENGKKETLESIGRDFNITRERVRQIEADGFLRLEPKLKSCQKIFRHFTDLFKVAGGLKKEEILLSRLGGEKYQSHAFFLLTLGEPFRRFSENKEFHPFWTINDSAFELAQKAIGSLYKELTKINKPLNFNECRTTLSISPKSLESFLEISKAIQKNREGLYGLKDWPEINPKSIRDKSYVVFKKEEKPLHFTQVAALIGPEALSQTVHNELIRDPRFTLVGRGLYALKEWGYEPGDVKDIILKTLEEAGRPLSREEILEKVLKQRLVKENTVLLNLGDKKHFLKTPQGKYAIKSSQC